MVLITAMVELPFAGARQKWRTLRLLIGAERRVRAKLEALAKQQHV